MSSKNWIVLGALVVLILASIAGWFAFRQQIYVFLMYHGQGNRASTWLAKLPNVDFPLLEKHLGSDKWFVRCSVIRTLRKLDDKARVLPILEKHISTETDSYCRLELAVGLLKFKEYDKARPILEGLRDDSKVGAEARDILKKLSAPAGA